MVDERRFHGIDRDLFQIVERKVVLFRSDLHLFCEIGIAHETVVAAEEYTEVVSEEDDERMACIIGGGSRTDVAGQAHLHGDTSVLDEVGEGPHLFDSCAVDRHVLDQSRSVPDPVRTADLYSLPD